MTLASVYPAVCVCPTRSVGCSLALTIETQSVDAFSMCVCVVCRWCRAVRRQMLVSYAYHARREATLGVGEGKSDHIMSGGPSQPPHPSESQMNASLPRQGSPQPVFN